MIGIKLVQDAVVASLWDIPALVADLSVANNIAGYDPEARETRSLEEAIRAMAEPSLLVVTRGVAMAYRGGFQRWQYNYAICMRAPGDFDYGGTHPGYFGMFQNIVDGLPASAGGLRWLDSTIHPDFDPPADVLFAPSVIGEIEVWQINFSLIEIGG